MVPRKFRERKCFSREVGHFGNKEFRTTPIYIYIYIVYIHSCSFIWLAGHLHGPISSSRSTCGSFFKLHRAGTEGCGTKAFVGMLAVLVARLGAPSLTSSRVKSVLRYRSKELMKPVSLEFTGNLLRTSLNEAVEAAVSTNTAGGGIARRQECRRSKLHIETPAESCWSEGASNHLASQFDASLSVRCSTEREAGP